MMVFPQPALKYSLTPYGLSQILHPLCVLYLSFFMSQWQHMPWLIWYIRHADQLICQPNCHFPCLSLKEIIKNSTLLPAFVENTNFQKTWKELRHLSSLRFDWSWLISVTDRSSCFLFLASFQSKKIKLQYGLVHGILKRRSRVFVILPHIFTPPLIWHI